MYTGVGTPWPICFYKSSFIRTQPYPFLYVLPMVESCYDSRVEYSLQSLKLFNLWPFTENVFCPVKSKTVVIFIIKKKRKKSCSKQLLILMAGVKGFEVWDQIILIKYYTALIIALY